MKNQFKLRTFLLVTILSGTSLAKKPPPLLNSGIDSESQNAPIVSLFSPEGRTGSGFLKLKIGDKTDTLLLGGITALYGSGLVIHSSALPEALTQEFQGNHLIQLAFGTLSSHLERQLPQFGSVTLVSKHIPSHQKVFDIVSMQNNLKSSDGRALLMFSPPSTAVDQSEEDRLKANFFGKAGTVILSPVGKPTSVNVQGERELYPFKSQTMHAEIKCELMNPFNPEPATLQGNVEIAVLWPNGSKSEKFIQRVASRAVGPIISRPVAPVQPLTQHPRDIAGSTRTDAKPGKKPTPN